MTVPTWHPVALSRALRPGGWLQVRLLDRTWVLHRGADGVLSAPAASDVGERHGLVWLAPDEPRCTPLHVPEVADRRYVTGALSPVRVAGRAAPLMATLAASSACSDVVRTPYALVRRHTGPPGGTDSTVVVVLQPEDDDSTRVFGFVLLREAEGRRLPARASVAAAVAHEQRWLERSADLAPRLVTA